MLDMPQLCAATIPSLASVCEEEGASCEHISDRSTDAASLKGCACCVMTRSEATLEDVVAALRAAPSQSSGSEPREGDA
jgi:hypothetical protein